MFVQRAALTHSLYGVVSSSLRFTKNSDNSSALSEHPRVHKHLLVSFITMSALVISIVTSFSLFPVASTIPISGAIVADVASKRVLVANGGVVESLRVHNGDLVSQGQILVRLDDRPLQERLQTLELFFARDTVRVERLEAEISGKRIFTTSSIGSLLPSKNFQDVVEYEQSLFRTYLDRVLSRQHESRIQVSDAVAAMNALKVQLDVLSERLAIAEGFTGRVRQLWSRQEATTNKLAQASDAELELRQSLAELRDKKLELVAKVDLLVEGAKATQLAEVSGLQAELDQVRREMASDRSEVGGLRLRLEQSIVRATCDCEITKLTDATPGTLLLDGQFVAELYPVHPHLMGIIRLTPEEVGFVHTTDVVEVRVAGAEDEGDLRLSGRIISVSHSLTDESGHILYEARVDFVRPLLGALQPDLRAGLPIAVFLAKRRTTLKWW